MTPMGRRIRALRERKRMNQSELARACGVTPATISRLESGTLKDVQTAIATRIARALGTSLDYLCGTFDDVDAEDEDPRRRRRHALAATG